MRYVISPKDEPTGRGPDQNNDEHSICHVVTTQAESLMKLVTGELEESVQNCKEDVARS